MKILVIADEEAQRFYHFYKPGSLKPYDVIVACGDLHREYLEFLVTMSGKPLLYVRGNHDDSYENRPPEGCTCIDGKLFVYQGVRFLGLGGSMKYRPDGENMYTEFGMRMRILKLMPRILWHRGFDILVTHAPAQGFGDMEDLPHKGFKCFVKLIEKYKPTFLLHGHIHRNYGIRTPRVLEHQDTILVNAWEYMEIEMPEEWIGKK